MRAAGTSGPTGRRGSGLTLVEVLVAAALLAIYVAACTAAFTLAARLQREAATIARRSAAFEPYVVAAGRELADLAHCPDVAAADAPDGDAATAPPVPTPGGVCLLEEAHCRIASGTVRCDGGDLVRARIAWTGTNERRDATILEAWSVVTP